LHAAVGMFCVRRWGCCLCLVRATLTTLQCGMPQQPATTYNQAQDCHACPYQSCPRPSYHSPTQHQVACLTCIADPAHWRGHDVDTLQQNLQIDQLQTLLPIVFMACNCLPHARCPSLVLMHLLLAAAHRPRQVQHADGLMRTAPAHRRCHALLPLLLKHPS
jgi:hypothetical protein